MLVSSSPCSSMLAFVSWFVFMGFFFVGGRSQAQNTLDPDEYEALILMFNRWGISSSLSTIRWNISGEVCSGAALGDFQIYDNPVFNPGILCDCSYNDNATCHITRLKAREFGLVGPVPRELERLKYLDNLDLGENYLTGLLPAFFGNFSAMKYLSIGFNLLSGTFPRELGKLQNLISLGIGYNNFSGPLPSEIGNMSSLEKIYLDSLGLSGEMPSTFSQLRKLRFMYASDNNFSGKLPDFIGNFTSLKSLRLQGNSFQGPIPSSFANLTHLTELLICSLLGGSSSLAFVSNMMSLSTLILRNSKISDTIPLTLGKYRNLQYLDLSFNNLTGTLPQSLFNLKSLGSLFLGNNSLSGSLPIEKSTTLLIVDLSYNELSGSLPPWVSDSSLQLNLVANNFVIDKSNQNILPWHFSCLQKDIPCNRGSPIYYSFAINCGGNETVTSLDGTLYEIDYHSLSAASYYLTDTTRWAVSSVGTFLEATNPMYTDDNSFQLLDTPDSELYETARIAPSSLRYYGLGLENGNYTVKLKFSETDFPDNNTWMSQGRRIFDIYIQGNLRAKDFDIRKQAGGLSFTPVMMEYTTLVTDNFLEIHLFWAGKGTCCIPAPGYYGPRISAISVTPNFKPTVHNRPLTSNKKDEALIIAVVVGIAALCFLVIFALCIWRKKRPRMDGNEDLVGLTVKPNYYSYAELRIATEGFSPSNKLGEGGFGSVFKGKLADGSAVAVKQLSEGSLQGKTQFITEIATISAVQHRNLVKLYGCCFERNKSLLVYEYLQNKSLDQFLFGNKDFHLDWPTRFEICLGTARGLAYLHEESRLRIVHRDVKSSNILLDSDLKPKISDFGLAKLYDDQKTHITASVAGTFGYLAPEYAMSGHLTEKVDVFAFGVVTFEILCGRKNTESSLDKEKRYLLEWVWNLHENGNDLEMVDPTLSSYDKDNAMRVISVAFLCTQSFPLQRPTMSRVLAMLFGDVEVNEVTSKPAYLADFEFEDITNISMSQIGGLSMSAECSSRPGAAVSSSAVDLRNMQQN